jgi:hypothetical protein
MKRPHTSGRPCLPAERSIPQPLSDVEADREQIRAEPSDVRRVARPTERVQACFGVVIDEELRARPVPSAPKANAHAGIGLNVLDVASMSPVLGDDEARRASRWIPTTVRRRLPLRRPWVSTNA